MKNKFDWEKFLNKDNKIVVNCKTKEEAKAFCNLMDKHELEWSSGDSYIELTEWESHKEKTCYDSNGSYSEVNLYEEHGYKVLEFSDYDFTEEPEKVILNAEFYKEEIDDLQGFFMITRSTNEIEFCNGCCEDCIFNKTGESCRTSTVKWLLSPYKPPKKKPVITDTVRKFLEVCNPESHIARDEGGLILFYEKKPSKTQYTWLAEEGIEMIHIDPDSVLFTCAVRYAIGRKSYMPELIWQELVLIIDRLSDRNLYVMKRDVESELKFDIPEKELWESLLEDINDEMQKRAAQKQK